MELEKLIEYGFLGLTSGLLAFAVKFLSNISKTNSTLATQVQVITNNLSWHYTAIQGLDGRQAKLDTAIQGLDGRVTKLEERNKK